MSDSWFNKIVKELQDTKGPSTKEEKEFVQIPLDKWRQTESQDDLKRHRQLYKCGDNFVTLTNIPTWKDTTVSATNKTTDSGKISEDCSCYFVGDGQGTKVWCSKCVQDINNCQTTTAPKFAINDIFNGKIALWQGDITRLELDAIVNAANESLLGGGGIDQAIHEAAGSLLVYDCSFLGGCPEGQTKITKGYNLPAKYVLHSSGPIGSENLNDLRSCYKTSLDLCLKHNLKSVGLCCISTGFYGIPIVTATHIALETVRKWLEENENQITLIIFVVYLDPERLTYEQLIPLYFPKNSK